MQIKFQSDEMAEVLAVFGKLVNGKSALPLAECVSIKPIDAKRVLLKATDTTDQIECELYAANDLTKSVAIRYNIINTLCVNNAHATIRIEFSEDGLTLTAKTNEAEYQATYINYSPEEWPYSPNSVDEGEHSAAIVNGRSLVSAFKRVAFACAKDEARIMMTGVYFDASGEDVRIVGTDGRMMLYTDVQTTLNKGASLVIPQRAIKVLSAMAPREVGFELMASDYCVATAEGYTYRFAPIEGRYPNYKAVFPNAESMNRATCSMSALTQALKRQKSYCNQSSGLVRIEFSKRDIKVMGRDNDYALSATEAIPCVCSEDGTTAIGVSLPFLLMELAAIEGNNVSIMYQDAARPILLMGADETIKALLMPMQLTDDEVKETKPAEQPKAEQPTEEDEEQAEDEETEEDEVELEEEEDEL